MTAGSFTINGIQIDILDTDTLNSVVSKITNSSAGVIATFDVATERVLLTQKTLGPGGQIVLGGDSSGFFDAVKLSAATPVLVIVEKALEEAGDDLARRLDPVANRGLILNLMA